MRLNNTIGFVVLTINIQVLMALSCHDYQQMIARIWKLKETSKVYFFLCSSVTPYTDTRSDLIISNILTETIKFEKFDLLMRGVFCYLLMLGREYKIIVFPYNPGQMQLEDETGTIIEFEEGEEL